MSITVYGISNCDTVRKALAWLAGRGVAHTFHDFKRQGVPADRLDTWLNQAGWERLLNRKGTMWRKLDPTVQASVNDAPSARVVMLSHPSVIKRPVVDWNGEVTVGFDVQDWERRSA